MSRADAPGPILLTIEGHERDLGGFAVRRVLPAVARRMVGPFIFLDHMGRARATPDDATKIEVRPHPHIGLATVTYLFRGAVLHRDSLGTKQVIHPGDINWITAGRGIVHSERAPEEPGDREPLHGLQLWVALPLEHEEHAPAFEHHPAATLPSLALGEAHDVRVRVLAGSCFGVTSPVGVLSPLFYVDVDLPADATIEVPNEHEDRAAYVVTGEVTMEGASGEPLREGRLWVLAPGARSVLRATSDTRLVLLGGAPVGPRFIEWNFVSSSRERIEEAKRAWREDDLTSFPKVPGDELDRIPLPSPR